MTTSTARLWTKSFDHIATESIPDDAITAVGNNIRIGLRGNGPLRTAIESLLNAQPDAKLPDMHISIDPEPIRRNPWRYRTGALVTYIELDGADLTITALVHARAGTHYPDEPAPAPETIYPPRGYGIGFLGRGNSDHAVIGCWATEDEARQAITTLRVFALGSARPSWDDNGLEPPPPPIHIEHEPEPPGLIAWALQGARSLLERNPKR
ncbi:hypothetical protein H7J86_26245 [Mycobacterium hackensackense]|uniref:hypothetical protein n=1 Tax=Mycobacterium hackensackense TaxID=228909 RepID=UPI002265B464|nr:hypothetical protein [Mycobacterium hackensackense]MCV7255670.1 hypothetical protein [Mycobacterium hackensackense]